MLDDWTPTRTGKQLCPSCSPTRRNKHDRCLSVTRDDRGTVWCCHNCGFSGAKNDTSPQTQGMDRGARDRAAACRVVRPQDGGGRRRELASGSLHGERPSGEPQVAAYQGQAPQDGQRRALAALERGLPEGPTGARGQSARGNNRGGMGRAGGDTVGGGIHGKRPERSARASYRKP